MASASRRSNALAWPITARVASTARKDESAACLTRSVAPCVVGVAVGGVSAVGVACA